MRGANFNPSSPNVGTFGSSAIRVSRTDRQYLYLVLEGDKIRGVAKHGFDVTAEERGRSGAAPVNVTNVSLVSVNFMNCSAAR